MKLLITGGHLTPALSLLTFLKTTSHSAVFVGRNFSRTRTKAFEAAEVQALGFPFVAFDSPKVNRYRLWESVFKLPLLLSAYWQAGRLLDRESPDVIVSFGGYLSVPFALAAFRRHLPIVIHEQTTTAGLANRWVSRLAQAVALSFPTSRRYFPSQKCTLVGNLLRPEFYLPDPPGPAGLPQEIDYPILFVTGGNQGSRSLNSCLESLYESLSKSYYLIHQTGPQPDPGVRLATGIRRPWFSALEIAWILKHAHVVISRAGANTVSELIAMGVPSILVPLPGSGEQAANAQLITQSGGGLLIAPADLSPLSITQALAKVEAGYNDYCRGLKQLQPLVRRMAAADLVALIQKTVKHSRTHV